MRPTLMIEGLNNLHDARYCAAVGIGMASFDLEQGSERALAPGVVQEMLDWLSGLEGVGVFGREPALDIAAKAMAAGVGWVMVPLEYDLDEAAGLGLMKIFDCAGHVLDARLTARLATALHRHPDARFVLPAEAMQLSDLPLDRCILRCNEPETLFRWVQGAVGQPYGYALGAFAWDADGLLDYDACDAVTFSYFQTDFA